MNQSHFDAVKYIGPNAHCLDQRVAAVLLENSTVSCRVYRPGTVDAVFFDQAMVLHEQTAEYLYSKFTPVPQTYIKGSRPFLEKVVRQVTAGQTSELGKALALLDWVRDLSVTYGAGPAPGGGFSDIFHGGAEEEVIRKGSDMCNEMSRVLGILAQIAGLASRYVGHMTPIDYDDSTSGTGHGVNEIFIDGCWAYFDIRGRYFIKADGTLASAWDLLQDPGLYDRQSPEVLAHRSPRTNHQSPRRYYEPTSVTIIANYLVADHDRYDYSWVYASPVRWREAREAGRQLRITRHKDILPQPRLRVV